MAPSNRGFGAAAFVHDQIAHLSRQHPVFPRYAPGTPPKAIPARAPNSMKAYRQTHIHTSLPARAAAFRQGQQQKTSGSRAPSNHWKSRVVPMRFWIHGKKNSLHEQHPISSAEEMTHPICSELIPSPPFSTGVKQKSGTSASSAMARNERMPNVIMIRGDLAREELFEGDVVVGRVGFGRVVFDWECLLEEEEGECAGNEREEGTRRAWGRR